MKKRLSLLAAIVFLTTFTTQVAPLSFAEETPTPDVTEGASATPEPTKAAESSSTGSSESKAELERKKRELEEKVRQKKQEGNTLASQIDYMDTQVYLTELKTSETERKITQTEKEIANLSNRIEGLDTSLDNLSRNLLDRVVDGYKQRNVTVLEYLLDSDNANDLVGKMKYVKTAQENNQKLLFQVQQTKSNFQEQKTLRQKKQNDLAKLKDTLAVQRQELVAQQESKRILLQVTQNDESRYQQQLESAKRDLAGFRSFVSSTGVGTISAGSLGTGEGGWYLSQRDSCWASSSMGNSNESVLDVGCFITSISMVFRSYGYDFIPTMISGNSRFFLGNTAFMYLPSTFNGSWPGGKSYKNISSGDIDSYLGRNIPVIAGVRGGSHYVVLKKEDGSDYIMNDPIYGPDLKVSDHYSLSGPFGVFE